MKNTDIKRIASFHKLRLIHLFQKDERWNIQVTEKTFQHQMSIKMKLRLLDRVSKEELYLGNLILCDSFSGSRRKTTPKDLKLKCLRPIQLKKVQIVMKMDRMWSNLLKQSLLILLVNHLCFYQRFQKVYLLSISQVFLIRSNLI